METSEGNKKLSLFIGITAALGILFFTVVQHIGVLYVMLTALVIEAFLFEKRKKENIWKYVLILIFLLAFVYVLFNFI